MGHRMLECCQSHFSPTDRCCHGNEIWDKIGYNSICVRDICEIFASIGGFRGWAIKCCQLHCSPTDPRCHGNEIWDKIGYNSVCVRDICEIFASIGGFLGMGHRMLECCQSHFSPTDCCCHGNKIWDKVEYNPVCVRDICEIFASIRGFSKMRHRMLPIAFFPDRPSLPWQRNLGHSWL